MPKEECPCCNGRGKIGGHITEDGEDQECAYCGGTGFCHGTPRFVPPRDT